MKHKRIYDRKQMLIQKIVCGICAFFLLVGTQPLEAMADVIWEPYEDDFYSTHYEECVHRSGNFLTNGESGYVTVFQSPESDREVAKIMNGESFSISFTWQDESGMDWGIVELSHYEPKEGESLAKGTDFGWVPMKDMSKIYDGNDFLLEYKDEFAEYGGELDDYKVEEQMIVWSYPGSEKVKTRLVSAIFDNGIPDYEYLYTDEDGNRWTFIGYYYGSVRGWVCVDYPEEESIVIHYEPEETDDEMIPAKEPDERLNEGESIPGLKLAAGLVTGVVAVTAGLIALLFGKRSKNGGIYKK